MASQRKEPNKPVIVRHNDYFNEAFSNPKVAKPFMRHVLPQEALDELDLDRLTVCSQRDLKDDRLFPKQADVIYDIPRRDGQGSVGIYVILEHKSYTIRMAIFQLWVYACLICRMFVLKMGKKAKTLPPIITIIIHHGRSRFTGPVELQELFPIVSGLVRFYPRFRALLFDLNVIPDDHPILNDPTAPELRVVIAAMKLVFHLVLLALSEDDSKGQYIIYSK